jgi:hypothetical protein
MLRTPREKFPSASGNNEIIFNKTRFFFFQIPQLLAMLEKL